MSDLTVHHETETATDGSSRVPRRPEIVETIRARIPSLAPSEARVARRILADPEAVMFQSVTELAGNADTSLSTVVRFCQTIGLRGFQDLKLALARESIPAVRRLQGDVEQGDPPGVVLKKILHADAGALGDAEDVVTHADFERLVETVATARRMLFVAVGTSAPLAEDAAYRLTTLGLDARAPADVHVQHVSAAMLGPGDLCFAVSHTGSTRETLAAVETARDAGATTAALTSFARSPLTDLVDVAVVAGSRETAFRVEAMASRLVHLAVLDALFVAVALRDPERAQRFLDRTGQVLTEHRF